MPFDSRFASIRRQETNVGNFVCDIVRSYTHADFVLLNSGTFRADAVGLSVSLILLMPSLSTCYSFCSCTQIQNAGPYRLKDLQILLPAENPIVTRCKSLNPSCLRLQRGLWFTTCSSTDFTGQQVLDALENGVSMYPNLEGRFPQVTPASP